MKFKFRIFSMALTLALMLMVSVGCFQVFANADSGEDVPAAEDKAAESEPFEAPDPTEEPEDDAASDEPVSGEDVVIVDTDDVYAAVTEQGRADDGDYFWKLHIENKTKTEAMVTMDSVSLDGLGADPKWGLAVAAGDKVDTEVFWTADSLSAVGLGDAEAVTTATFRFNAYDNEDWAAPSYFNELVTIYFVDEADAKPFAYEPSDTDTVVFDTDEAMMVVTDLQAGAETNGYEDGIATANVVLVNKSDDTVRFVMPDTMIAGSPYKSATMDKTVPPHASVVTSFKWTFTISYMQGLGLLDASGAFVPNVEFTLNMKVTDVDDLTVPTIAEGAYAFTR